MRCCDHDSKVLHPATTHGGRGVVGNGGQFKKTFFAIHSIVILQQPPPVLWGWRTMLENSLLFKIISATNCMKCSDLNGKVMFPTPSPWGWRSCGELKVQRKPYYYLELHEIF